MTRIDANNADIRRLDVDQAALETIAEAAADAIRQAAPVETGSFKRSVKADGARVISTDPFAHLIEFGSAHNHPYAPFRRGLRAAGFRVDDAK